MPKTVLSFQFRKTSTPPPKRAGTDGKFNRKRCRNKFKQCSGLSKNNLARRRFSCIGVAGSNKGSNVYGGSDHLSAK